MLVYLQGAHRTLRNHDGHADGARLPVGLQRHPGSQDQPLVHAQHPVCQHGICQVELDLNLLSQWTGRDRTLGAANHYLSTKS